MARFPYPSLRAPWNEVLGRPEGFVPGRMFELAERPTHPLAFFTEKGSYERETALDGQPPFDEEPLREGARLLIRARMVGVFDPAAFSGVSQQVLGSVVDACRSEGIPVLSDAPTTMHVSTRRLGQLLAHVHLSAPGYPDQYTRHSRWVAELSNTWQFRFGQLLRLLKSTPPTPEAAFAVDSQLVGEPKFDVLEYARRTIEEISAEESSDPEALHALLAAASHLGVDLPTLRLPPAEDLRVWRHLDVTTRAFFAVVREQPETFRSMSGHQFEDFVAQLFQRHGFVVEKTKRSHDGGFDMRLIRSVLPGLDATFLVECKNPRSGAVVGVEVVRAFRGISSQHRTRTSGGILVASTRFSPQARAEAEQSFWQVSLFDQRALLDLLDTARWPGHLLG